MAQIATGRLSASTQRSVVTDQGPSRVALDQGSTSRPQPRCECTYKMGPDRRFPPHEVRNIIESVLETELSSKRYDPEMSQRWCCELADKIRDRVKDLGHFRYKVIALVTIGSTDRGAVCCASQCVWNDQTDSFGEYTYKNGSLYAIGTVYGIYQE